MHETPSEKTAVDDEARAGSPSGSGALEADPRKAGRIAAEKARRERASAKLRENLARRKQQARARRAGEADQTDGLPAIKLDEAAKLDESS